MVVPLLRDVISPERLAALVVLTMRSGVVLQPDFPGVVELFHQLNQWTQDPNHPPPVTTWLRGVPVDLAEMMGMFGGGMFGGGGGGRRRGGGGFPGGVPFGF